MTNILNGGELYAATHRLAGWQSTDLAELPHKECCKQYEHEPSPLLSLMASGAKEAV